MPSSQRTPSFTHFAVLGTPFAFVTQQIRHIDVEEIRLQEPQVREASGQGRSQVTIDFYRVDPSYSCR